MDDIKKDRTIVRMALAIEKIYGSPKELIKRGFLIGLASGVGGVIGAALIIILLGYLVSKLGGTPLIGDFLQEINRSIPLN
ncbi:MAG: DUF5665 domain-containing protein [Patescibacteria group bacterium]